MDTGQLAAKAAFWGIQSLKASSPRSSPNVKAGENMRNSRILNGSLTVPSYPSVEWEWERTTQ